MKEYKGRDCLIIIKLILIEKKESTRENLIDKYRYIYYKQRVREIKYTIFVLSYRCIIYSSVDDERNSR